MSEIWLSGKSKYDITSFIFGINLNVLVWLLSQIIERESIARIRLAAEISDHCVYHVHWYGARPIVQLLSHFDFMGTEMCIIIIRWIGNPSQTSSLVRMYTRLPQDVSIAHDFLPASQVLESFLESCHGSRNSRVETRTILQRAQPPEDWRCNNQHTLCKNSTTFAKFEGFYLPPRFSFCSPYDYHEKWYLIGEILLEVDKNYEYKYRKANIKTGRWRTDWFTDCLFCQCRCSRRYQRVKLIQH